MIEVFHISKLIVKKKLGTLTDSEKSELKKFNKEYPFSKEIKIEELTDRIESYATINKKRAWESIEKKSEKRREKPVFVLYNKTWYKYAAAAVFVGIMVSTYFLKNSFFNTPVESIPTIVNTNVIEPGTGKATLTLEDGSVVALEKGNTYQTQNANSNGEKIIYEAGNKKTKKIVHHYLTIPRGGEFHMVMADGTEVWLNSESQLKYPISFIEGVTREVELVYGEAYFDVSPSTNHKGAKFKVLNRSQEIEVLGTEFNIKAYKDETNIYTTLVEGKVVVNNGVSKQNLMPNQQSNLDLRNNSIIVAEINVESEISWKKGIFSFEGKTLNDIMIVLSRWYDVDIVFENKDLKSVKFNGILDKSQSIEEILLVMKSSSINNYEIKNKTITLK
ncbi:MAG: FecR family protein [Algibacter sp.]